MNEVIDGSAEKMKSEGGADWSELERMADRFEEGKDTVETEKNENLAEKVERLRSWINLEEMATKQDPEGLVRAEQRETERSEQIKAYQTELARERDRYEQYGSRAEEIDGEIEKAKSDLYIFDNKNERGRLSGLKKALGIGARKRAKLQGRIDALTTEEMEVKEKNEDNGRRIYELESEIRRTEEARPKQEFLEGFETPLSSEEKKEGLDLDALAELSTKEYLQLWRRLNPFYLTHATRQGIRDHVWTYHSHGQGEYNNGLMEILADEKKMKTPIEVSSGLGREINSETVATALDRMLGQDRIRKKFDIDKMRAEGMNDGEIVDRIVEILPVNSSIGEADAWGDARAVHFGQNTVLDELYGGETGNEVFFVFPTDVLASQCRINGNGPEKGLVEASIKEDKLRNNIFVWPKEKDITVDAGLTFLPKSTMVDPETGSKYATKIVEREGREVRVPEIDVEEQKKTLEWLTSFTMDEVERMETEGIERSGSFDIEQVKRKAREIGVSEQIMNGVVGHPAVFLDTLKRFLERGDYDDSLRRTYGEARLREIPIEQRRELSVRQFLDREMWGWKEAENAIPAEEYWEKRFREHPEQRPAHVIYYDGNPSVAVKEVLREAGILEDAEKPVGVGEYQDYKDITGRSDTSGKDGVWLGFEENRVEGSGERDPVLQEEHEKFNKLAREMIAARYGLKIEES